MSEALVPAAAATWAVTDKGGGGGRAVAGDRRRGAGCRLAFLEFFAGRIANERPRAACLCPNRPDHAI